MDMAKIHILLLLVFACAVNSDDMTCVKLNGRELTWSDCLEEINKFVGDLDTVFKGSNPMIWPPKTEAEVKDLCIIYEAASDHDDVKRSDLSPEMEQYLNEGFHDMMEYILCEKDGTKGYIHAGLCLGDNVVREQIKGCFEEYGNFNHSYHNIKASDARIREHCKFLKAYQQCRIDVFRNNCDSTVAEWNNRAFTEYYNKYADEVHCNIDGGLTTEEIIYVVLGCIGGVLVLFCLCFVYSRFQNCSGSNSRIKNLFQAMSTQTNKKKQEEKKKKKKEAKQSNEDVNKGKEKDVESGKAKENGEVKPETEGGYYNTKELDNNSVNERKEEESENHTRKYTIEEQDDQEDNERDQRRRDYRDSPHNPRRDYPRDYPRGSPRDYPRGSPRDRYLRDYRRDYSPRLGNRSGSSYDYNFHARVHGGGPPPRNIDDVRRMMKPRGLHRY